MTDEELRQRLSDNEDSFTERKSAGVKSQELRQTLSAFANSLPEGRTAILFLGVDDRSGAVTGVPVDLTDLLQKRVRDTAEKDCYPPIKTVVSRVLTVEDKLIVAVIVRASADRPHFTGPAYVRRLSESVNASTELFEDLILSRNDKTRVLLELRGQLVTVQCIGHKLGDTQPVADQGYREQCECRIDVCDAHVAILTVFNGGMPGWQVAEPTSHIQLSFDVRQRRSMLVIRAHA